MMETTMKLNFVIYSDKIIDHNEITNYSGLVANRSYIVGEKIHENLRATESLWLYSSSEVNTLSVDTLLDDFISKISGRLESLKLHIIKNKLNVRFNIIVKYRGDIFPSIFLNTKFIAICNELNAAIDIDVV